MPWLFSAKYSCEYPFDLYDEGRECNSAARYEITRNDGKKFPVCRVCLKNRLQFGETLTVSWFMQRGERHPMEGYDDEDWDDD